MSCAVAVAVAPVRAAPRDEAEQVTQALLGEPLRVEERRGGWARVVTSYGYPGWIRSDVLADVPGALAAPTAAEPLSAARAYLGAPYEWGGMTRAGIDCSGLVHMAYRATGVVVPRDAWQQEAAAVPVTSGEERPGDLVTYGGSNRADHVSFWCGGGTILHATAREGLGVVEEPEPEALSSRRRAIVRLSGPCMPE